jgi:hypothetical protein
MSAPRVTQRQESDPFGRGKNAIPAPDPTQPLAHSAHPRAASPEYSGVTHRALLAQKHSAPMRFPKPNLNP